MAIEGIGSTQFAIRAAPPPPPPVKKLKLTKKPQAILQSFGSEGVDAVVSLESFILLMMIISLLNGCEGLMVNDDDGEECFFRIVSTPKENGCRRRVVAEASKGTDAMHVWSGDDTEKPNWQNQKKERRRRSKNGGESRSNFGFG